MPTAPAQVSPLGFDRLYGLELLELGDDRARARVLVRDELRQPDGHVHGGVYTALAEGLAATATARSVEPEGRIASLLSLQASFLHPITGGSINAAALARHRGRTTWVWEVEISDDRGLLCASCRVTIAVSGGSGAA